MPKNKLISLAVAALGVELLASTPKDIRLLPAGEFRSVDGRPVECASWVMTDEDGARLVAEMAARDSACVIDYEHATLHAKKTGAKAVAAGWYQKLEWRTGDGLWAIDVDWTALAAQEIEDKQYRFISPVFTYDRKSGRVKKLLHAALTNDPGLDGLTDLAVLASEIFLNQQPTEVSAVNEELLEQLRWLLNLPVGTTAEEIATHLGKLIDQLKGGNAAAASFDLAARLAEQTTQIATLTAQVASPDPALFASVATLTAVQGENAALQTKLAALAAEVDGTKLNVLISDGMNEGKITPAMEAWARELGKKDLAALTSFIAAAPVAVTPGKTQTGHKKPKGVVEGDNANAIAEAALQYQADQAAKGIMVTTVQAVAHINNQTS